MRKDDISIGGHYYIRDRSRWHGPGRVVGPTVQRLKGWAFPVVFPQSDGRLAEESTLIVSRDIERPWSVEDAKRLDEERAREAKADAYEAQLKAAGYEHAKVRAVHDGTWLQIFQHDEAERAIAVLTEQTPVTRELEVGSEHPS